MKTILSGLIGVAFTLSTLAIPQNFNGNGFFTAAGLQFEDFASQPPALGAGATMKGKWAVVRGQKDLFKQELEAVVFGIPATEIQAQKAGDIVLSYRVQYSASEDKKRGKQQSKLEARVLAAVSAYTGASAELGKPIDHKGVKILVSLGGNGDVFVTFSPDRVNPASSRRHFLVALASAGATAAFAQQFPPFRAPPFPVDALTKLALWSDPAFLESWRPPPAHVRMACRAWPGPVEIFGLKAHGALAFFEAGHLRSISLLFLDSGAWFGYVPDAQAKMTAAARGVEFSQLFQRISAAVAQSVGGLGGKSREVPLGGKTLLKHTGHVAQLGDVWSRLVIWPEHLVKLTLYRDDDSAANLLAASRREPKKEDQVRAFGALVQRAENGDRTIENIPLLPQGDRAYCGMAALAMIMQHLGVRIETEELAAAAGIKFGSTQGAKPRETCDAAADVGGLRMERTQKFDFVRARAAIDAGMPALVFRHWAKERDFIHTAFARRLATDPTATLPKADMNDRKLWPVRGGFAHASIVNGYNQARGEVIFTESWAEQVRNRRMRAEEMEGTSYVACYPRLG